MTFYRVSISAINNCKETVKEIKSIDPMFSDAIQVLTELNEFLTQLSEQVGEEIVELQNASIHLDSRIGELEEEIDACESELTELRENRAELLIAVAENVAGAAFELAETESKIAALKIKLTALKVKLHEANGIRSQVVFLKRDLENDQSHIVSSLPLVVRYMESIQNVQHESSLSADSVISSLYGISALIEQYLQIRMDLESFQLGDSYVMQTTSGKFYNDQSFTSDFSEISEENNDHMIELNDFGRICSYDGKSFGGLFRSYEDRLAKVSIDSWSLGHFEGVRGESKYIPSAYSAKGLEVIEILKGFELNGIEYRNAEPDFEVCCITSLKITDMTSDRGSNFSSADKELAKLWCREGKDGKTDWKQKDIKKYRQKNRLTWHEKCDTETMVLVRREINHYFKHSGGVSECRVRDGKTVVEGAFDE